MSAAIKKVVFISGSIGLLLGILISSLLFPRIVTKNNTIISEKKILDTVFVQKDKIVIKEVEKRIVIMDTIRVQSDSVAIYVDSIDIDTVSQDSDIVKVNTETEIVDSVEIVGSTVEAITDTIDDNTSSYSYVRSGESDIRVSKNELVYVMIIKPEGNPSNFYCNKNSELDSLLMDNTVERPDVDGIRVEFWASPLNTTGYRLNKHRLVLFGFYEYKHVKLKYMDDGRLNLTYFNNSYHLGCEDDFHSLIIKK